jgi:hypothetical protein
MKRTLSVLLVIMLAAAARAWAQGQIPGDVVSLFQKRCTDCHKGKNPPRGLSWEAAKIAAAVDAPSKEMPDLKIIDTASPESSYVLKKVRGEKGIHGSRMPPAGAPALGAEEIKILETWIQGLKKLPVPAST